jgi:hypothetical protein
MAVRECVLESKREAGMKEKRYVQHISGQGQKWEVVCERSDEWAVWMQDKKDMHYIPLSEYRLCDTPEVWEDVTEYIEPSPVSGNWSNVQNGNTVLGVSEPDYRIRKVSVFAFARPIIDPAQREMCAFVVEKRKV